MARIFLSYRRDDAMGYSLLLYDRLNRYFGRGSVFMDVDTIPPGLDFLRVIEREVSACNVLIALIGKQWLAITDALGQRRIAQSDDYVQLEIAIALERGIPVIPVLLRGALMPTADQLPDALKPLARRQAVSLSDERIDYDLKRLLKAVLDVTAKSSWLDALALTPPSTQAGAHDNTLVGGSKTAPLHATRLLFEPEIIAVPAGEFLSGDTLCAAVLPDFWIAHYPVKVGEFRAFLEMGGYGERRYWTESGWYWKESLIRRHPDYWDDPLWTGNDWLPVIGVSWYEAHAYCAWLAEKTGLPYRLPSTLEWEKAARGTDGRIYPWGRERRQGVCNIYGAGISQTSQVGRFSPAGDSPYGIADMIGNVAEWCATRWTSRADGPLNDDSAGDVPRVQHGGSWCSTTPQRAAMRIRGSADFTSNYVGFRVARSALE